jgi:hypothetical protein
MPRLQTIAGFAIIAIAILLAIISEVAERRGAAKLDAEFAELRKTICQICSSIEMRKANHITSTPWVVAAKGQRPWKILQHSHVIPEDCEPDQTTFEVDAGIAALFELHDGSPTCVVSTRIPASGLASLTTTERSDAGCEISQRLTVSA